MDRNTMEPPVCRNVRSRRHPDQRCSNPATIGEYCGVHNKHPRPFEPKQSSKDIIVSLPVHDTNMSKKIGKWLITRSLLKKVRRQGHVYAVPEISNNTTDFYSMEDIVTINKSSLFSSVDADMKMYAFDIRSLASLLEKKTEEPINNPYTRQPISELNIKRAVSFIRWSRKKGLPTRWDPIQPNTPDQIFQLKVTDLFQKIDELNYYTDAHWFIKLGVNNLRRLYVELYDIWYHRAGLSNEQRGLIIPGPARPFRFSIREVITLKNIEVLRKINLDMIRMFVSAATDKSDRGLGAMYILTALTLVCRECAESYPWLYESANPGVYDNYAVLQEADQPAVNFLNAIFNGNAMFMPFLALPPALPQ